MKTLGPGLTVPPPATGSAFARLQPTASFPYRILALVGEGGMGEVYRAQDLELGRQVAIKVIKPEFLSALDEQEAQAAMQRFVQEARAAAALTHPGVTVVHRVGSEGGWPYIAMEWLDGQTLEQLLRERGRLGLAETARLGLQALAVLDAAHAAGIVHRDIKPANLMLTRDGRLKIADFGIARVQGSNLAQTRAGVVMGTPQYAAPEQLAGKPVDARSDLYALGAVLHECLTGAPPFAAANIYELILAVQTQELVPPSARVPGLPPELDAFARRALARSPQDRFASARDMARALQPFITGGATLPPDAQGAPTATGLRSGQRVSVVVRGRRAPELVASVLELWPPTPLGRQDRDRLLERLAERPLHAPAFCGALQAANAWVLFCDGLVWAAFAPGSDADSDAVLESLPPELDATLRAAPAGLDPRVVPLLASLLGPPEPRLVGLDASFTDLPQLARRLQGEGFDGALRFVRDGGLGFSLVSRGRPVLDLFGEGWPAEAARATWEAWIGASGAMASVEPLRSQLPAVAYRSQLAELRLDVVRPERVGASALRVDTLAEAQALTLQPRDDERTRVRRGDSTLQGLLDGDPAAAAARWVLVDLGPQFDRFGRRARWKALVDPLERVAEVRLHHALPAAGGSRVAFDAVTMDAQGRPLHLIERASVASADAVARFVDRAVAAYQAQASDPSLGGAILIAPPFDDESIAAYLEALRYHRRASLLGGLDAFSHREGFVRLGARAGLHLLLVEEDAGRRRPLVPE